MSGESLRDCFANSCLRWGQKRAITFLREGKVETEISYAGLNQDSSRLANMIQEEWGVQKGDRVILFIQKSLFFVIAHLALQEIGAIGVPLNPGFKKSEMVYLLHDADAKLCITGNEQAAIIKQIDPEIPTLVINTHKPYQDLEFLRSSSDVMPQAEIQPQDPGLIIYTSGTTGTPKGAMLTQKNLIHDAHNIIHMWEIYGSDRLCHALPLFHVHGLCFALHTAVLAGAHIVMLDQFSPEHIVDALMKKDHDSACTIFMAVPAMYNKMMDYVGEKRLDFTHMRLWTSGSAPLLPHDFERIKKIFGKEPVEREGMSETGMNFSNPLRGRKKPGSIGLPLASLEVRIVDPETFIDVVTGQEGEIWLKSPAISPGYWRKPEETKKAFEKGWFRTADLGQRNEDGYYFVTDRIKHIIISGGENISPKEVEAVINQLGDVIESSVIGIPDRTLGEKVVGAVVIKNGSKIKPREIQAYCKVHLHDWKCPKEIIFLKTLPRNTMGKVLKEDLKDFLDTSYRQGGLERSR
jgi:malonyl-CoA/methylmalonyl-CoA synthetase